MSTFVVESSSWRRLFVIDNTSSELQVEKTITHTVGLKQINVSGVQGQIAISIGASTYGCSLSAEHKIEKFDLGIDEKNEATSHCLKIHIAPHKLVEAHQRVLHCTTVATTNTKLIPFEVLTQEIRIASYSEGEERTEPTSNGRPVMPWSGYVLCIRCQTPVHVLRLKEGNCTHTQGWHSNYEDCNYLKCAMRLRTNIGQQHWGCCGETQKDASKCKNNKEHTPGPIKVD